VLLAGCVVFAATAGAASFAQGTLPEPPGLLASAPAAETFRGVLAPRVDLSPLVPPPRSQRPSKTCVSWSVTYAAASEALRRADPSRPLVPLSPSFTYSLAGGTPTCQRGTSIIRTLEVLRTIGTLPLESYAFDANACSREPTPRELASAAHWRIKAWSKVDARDLDAVKGQLARGRPVIFAMDVGPRFHAHRGAGVIGDLDTEPGLEGHAMVLVGYDDTHGAFRVQNSGGRDWGEGGYAWIGYATWQKAVRDGVAFVID
jgi:cathepsin K